MWVNIPDMGDMGFNFHFFSARFVFVETFAWFEVLSFLHVILVNDNLTTVLQLEGMLNGPVRSLERWCKNIGGYKPSTFSPPQYTKNPPNTRISLERDLFSQK